MENLIFFLVIALIFALIFSRENKLNPSNKIYETIVIGVVLVLIGLVFVEFMEKDTIGIISGISVIIGAISLILGSMTLIISVIGRIGITLGEIGKHSDYRPNQEIKKSYPKLSILSIMQERKANQKFKTIYLLLIATMIYIFASKFFDFAASNIFLGVLLESVLLIALESLIFNYRVNQGWYGSNESEAREIIDFILKNSEDIDFTDGNSPKSIIKPEDIQQIGEELGIWIPGYPQPNAISKSFNEG